MSENKRGTFVVAVYLVDRCYGGPEEGGWWYDAGNLVRTVKVFKNENRAIDYCRRLNRKLDSRTIGPNVDRRDKNSVLSEGVYEAHIYEIAAPMRFPEERPRYE